MDAATTDSATDETPGAELAEWTATARRLTPMIDGVEYYAHLRRALIGAREQVTIVGWDVHSEIDLLRGDDARRARREDDWPVRLADLLERLVGERDGLTVRMLIWEGSALFVLERQHLPRMKRVWRRHPRLRLEWDRNTPPLGSQHEKFVVVDDRVAFVGGMDLTRSRWDSHEHALEDSRRRNPGLVPHHGDPFHDVMMAVDDEAARVLGEWARERWRRATGEALDPPRAAAREGPDPWPPELTPLLRDPTVAFVRTQPAHDGREEKRQVEAAYLAQIRAARRLVYVETQFLAHQGVTRALAERLRDPDGPEVVVILPADGPGLVQSLAMDTRRDALLDDLRAADPGGRLGVYWPTLRGGEREPLRTDAVYVHAKVLIVDDRLLRIGSSNLNNRSMGLDAELDAFVRVGDEQREAVAGFRRRLVGHLLHVAPGRVAGAEREHGSLVAAIEALRGGRRTLHPFEHRAEEALHVVDLPIELADPSRPLDEQQVERVLAAIEESTPWAARLSRAKEVAVGTLRHHKGPLIGIAAIVACVLVWRATPLHEWVDVASLSGAIEAARAGPLGGAALLCGLVLLATLGFPVTVLIATVGATLDAHLAIPLAALGVTCSALLSYAIGTALRSAPRSGLGAMLERVEERVRGRGVLAVALLRNVPVAPFALVNAGCGMAHVPLGTFLAGTLIGMAPGLVLLCLFGLEARRWLEDPTAAGLLPVLGIAALVVAASRGAELVMRRVSKEEGPGADAPGR